jgi:hypothetical protein
MIGATIIFYFLVEMGAGTLLTLWLLRRFELTHALRRLVVLVSGSLVAVALPFGAQAFAAGPGLLARLGAAPVALSLALVTACAILVALGAGVRRGAGAPSAEVPGPAPLTGRRAILLLAAALAGFASLAAGAGALGATGSAAPPSGFLLSAHLLSAALLLGSTLGAMLVGHWYLVDRKMPIDPLRLAGSLLLLAVVARIAFVAVPAARFWSAQSAAGFEDPAAINLSIFWIQRVLFGLLGPLVLAFMVRHTVGLRATQSATGLLYVVLIFVIAGEMISHYLLLRTGMLL